MLWVWICSLTESSRCSQIIRFFEKCSTLLKDKVSSAVMKYKFKALTSSLFPFYRSLLFKGQCTSLHSSDGSSFRYYTKLCDKRVISMHFNHLNNIMAHEVLFSLTPPWAATSLKCYLYVETLKIIQYYNISFNLTLTRHFCREMWI